MHFLHAWRTLSPGQPLLPFDKPGSDWQAARTKLVFHRHGPKCRPSSMDVRQLPRQTKPASVRHMYSGASATHRHSNRKTAASVTMQPRGWCSRMHSNKKASHALAHTTSAYVHKTNTYCTLCGGMQAGTYTQTQTCKHTHTIAAFFHLLAQQQKPVLILVYFGPHAPDTRCLQDYVTDEMLC